MDDPTRPRPAQASPSFDVDAYLAAPRPATGAFDVDAHLGAGAAPTGAFDVDAHLAASPYAKVAPLMFGTAPLAPTIATPGGTLSGEDKRQIGAALGQPGNGVLENAARGVGAGLLSGGVNLARTVTPIAAGMVGGPAALTATRDALAQAAPTAQQAIATTLHPRGTPGKVGAFVGEQVPTLAAFGALAPVGEAAAGALPLAGRLAPAASRIASMGTAAALTGAVSAPDNPVAGAVSGLKFGAGLETPLAGLGAGLTALRGTPVEAPVTPEAGAAPFVERRVGAPMPDVPVPLRRRVADAIDPEGAAKRDLNPITKLQGASPWEDVQPIADAHPDVEIVSADAVGLKHANDTLGPKVGNALIQRQADAYRQAAVEAGLDPRRVLFTPKGDELYAVVPQGMGQQIGERATALMGTEPFVHPTTGAEVPTGTRFGVGATTDAADEALNAAKAAGKAPPAPPAAPPVASTPSGADATPEAAASPATGPTPPLPASDAQAAAEASTGQAGALPGRPVQSGTSLPVLDRAGGLRPTLAGGLAGGLGAGAFGYATGKTPEERATRAATFGLGGAVAGALGGRAIEGADAAATPASDALTPDPRRAATGFAKVADDFRRVFAPTTRTPEAATTGLVMRQRLGEMKQANAQTMQALHDFRTSFAAAPDADRLAFIDRMERGAPQPTPALTQAATALRTVLDQTRDQIRALGTGKLDQFIANYFPHIWENPDGAQSVVGRMLGQRPLEGSKSFLKERTIPTTAEGIAAGLKPVTTNPVDLTMLKLREMRKYLMAQQVLGDLKGRGLLKFVRSSESAPEGWTMLNDRVSTVTGPRDLSPAGPVIVGHQYAPGPVAEVVNNYLAPGLGGNALYDSYRLVGNTLNQAQLGLSAFHLGFTSLDAAISKAALGVMQGSRGDVGAAMKSAFGIPFAPVTTLLKGDKVLREYLTPGSQPAFADVVRSVTAAGGVAHLDDFYRTGMYDRFRDDWQQHTGQMVARTLTGAAVGGGTAAAYGALTAPAGADASTRAARFGAAGAALGAGVGSRALGAVLDLAAKPVMEYVVPRQKLGVFADLSREMIGRLGPNASPDAVRAAAAEAWNSVDNRMGQLVYDNLFWHRAAKDLAMASVRSVGWNLGDFRELGGGVTDLAQTARQVAGGTYHGLSPRTAYTLALPLTVGLAGGVMTYLATGERPRSLLDYYYPRTGRQNPDGTEERVQLPSYMRDVYAYAHHPWTTLQHKLNPLAEGVAEMLNNKDFYGNMVRNPDDPALTQLGQVAAFAGDQFTPFGVRNAQDARHRGQSDATTAANFVGVTPAPRDVVRSDAENRMQELLSRRGIIVNTPEQVAARNARFQLERTLHTDPVAGRQALAQAVQAGTLTPQQRHQMLQRNFQDPTKLRFQQLTLPEALDVYQRATPEERQTWWPALLAKRSSAQSRGDRAALRAYQAARPMDLPRGHLAGQPTAGGSVALARPTAGVTP